MLYADGMITPAISVLSAVEGLHVATPLFDPYVVPIAVAILIGLFLFQSRGTTGVGKVSARSQSCGLSRSAFSGFTRFFARRKCSPRSIPGMASSFFLNNGARGFVVLGAVFLVVTGGEALYADIGHFGTRRFV